MPSAFCCPYCSRGVGRGRYSLHSSGAMFSNCCRVAATHNGLLHLPAHEQTTQCDTAVPIISKTVLKQKLLAHEKLADKKNKQAVLINKKSWAGLSRRERELYICIYMSVHGEMFAMLQYLIQHNTAAVNSRLALKSTDRDKYHPF